MKKPRSKKSAFLRESPIFEEEEFFSISGRKRGTSLFLGKYTMNQVTAVLAKKNFFKEAQKRKLWPLDFSLDSSDYPLQRLQIFYKEKKPENVVVDLKIKEGVFHPKKKIVSSFPASEYKFLILDWLSTPLPWQSIAAVISAISSSFEYSSLLSNRPMSVPNRHSRLG